MSTAIVPSSASPEATASKKTPGATGAMPSAATSILIQNQIEIPLGITSLEDFRRWARSESLPEQGRIDYIDGRIEVDLMVENLFYHGAAKAEIARIIGGRVAAEKSGRWFIDCTRISHPQADLSSEPDLIFLSFASIATKRVTYVQAKADDPDSFVEIEGSPDWICEIVSDSSEQKDTVRLAEKYFAAGVTEYWLVDARGTSLDFSILTRGKDAFVQVETDADGYQTSSVFQRRYHFTRERGPDGHWTYFLDEQPLK